MDLFPELKSILELSGNYAEDVSERISDRPNDIRAVCFWSIRNRTKITEEILSFYDRSWKDTGIDVNDEDINSELVERIITVTKNLFVDVVSMIEKTAKETLEMYPANDLKRKALENRNYLYLRNILQASSDSGLISEEDLEEWDDILVMRNLVAHNNSVSDRSKKFMVSGVTISMRPGRMMKGPLGTFIILSERIMTLFYQWILSLDGTKYISR